jgi:26S proteasome non-ATPase regulatory subunit 10
MMKLLLDNKSPLDATDIDGMTALHHGMWTFGVNMALMGLYERRENRADREILAISEGHGDAALFLLKAGIDHTKVDRDGNMALKLAPDVKVRHNQQSFLIKARLWPACRLRRLYWPVLSEKVLNWSNGDSLTFGKITQNL